jgi:hypothetical protein
VIVTNTRCVRGAAAILLLVAFAAACLQFAGAATPGSPAAVQAGGGLPSSSRPAYSASVRETSGAAAQRRIELHWSARPGSGQILPTLWEPESQCRTFLMRPERHGAGHWMLVAEGDASTPANDDCRPGRRIGGLAGIDNIRVLIEARGEQISYRVRVIVRRTGNAAPAVLEGVLLPSERIAAKQAGYFGEVSLVDFGVDKLDGIYLVTNTGIFRGTDRAAATGRGGFIIVERSDLHARFPAGDLYWSATTSALDRRISFAERIRFGDGRGCPDQDTESFAMDVRLLALHDNVRTWSAVPPPGAPGGRFCAVEQLNVTRCRRIGCLQWSSSLTQVDGQSGWFLTESERTAREIYARLAKWTIANRAYRTDSPPAPRRGDASSPWGECGLEGCDARRRREAMESLLIDLWNN